MRSPTRPLALLAAGWLAFAALAVTGNAHAESDTVFLKNGKKVTGAVIDDDARKGVTIVMKDGKKRTFARRLVDHVEKAPLPPPEKKEPPPAPPPPAALPPEPEPEEEAPPPPPAHLRSGVSFGVGADLALVRAKSLGPSLGMHGIVDIGTKTPFYVRLEPGFAYFTRSTAVNVVSSIYVPVDPAEPPEIGRVKITNNVRVLQLHTKVSLGYDIGQSFTARLGGILGYASATTDAAQCSGGSNSGLTYGGSLVPIALRALEKKQLELGANVDYQLVPVPKCDLPAAGSITVDPGQTTVLEPAVKKQRIAAIFFGLHLSYLFK
jgi:hypothetical protein